jgi:hypothetical protein
LIYQARNPIVMGLGFATTRDVASFLRYEDKERRTSGDPRPSLQALYGNHEGFVRAVDSAALELVEERFLLEVDAQADIQAAKASMVLR